MKRTLLLIVLASFAAALNAQTHYSKEIEAQIKQVENSLAGDVVIEGAKPYNILERMAHYKVKGLSVAVVHNYQIVWAKGYGWADEKEKRPVTTETLFEPGSISKSFNALGVLKLVQEKKLDLNKDINVYLKTWKFPYDSVSKNKKITLANLLSHTAGLSVHGFEGYNRFGKIPTLPQILDGKEPANSEPVRSMFEPGLRFEYSGGGTTISQLLLIDQTVMAYDQFIAKNVFQPLGMDHSFFTQPPPADKLSMVATGYREDGSEVDGKFHVYPEQAAAGQWTTPTDLCKYIIETQLAYEGRSAKVLNQEMTRLRLTPYIDNSAALGVFIENRGGSKYFQHGAGNEGFRGFYYGSLDGGNGVVVFVNSDEGRILSEVINSVASVYEWKGFNKPVTKKVVTIPDDVASRYKGVYAHEGAFAIILQKEDGYYCCANGACNKMFFTGSKDFFSVESPVTYHLLTNDTGASTGMLRAYREAPSPAWGKVFSSDTLNGDENFFNQIGWVLLENRKYEEAMMYLNRGLKLYPKSLITEGNLAHCYLFLNEYDSALKIYKAHLGENLAQGPSWEEMINQDFTFFKRSGFDQKQMDRVFKDLNLKIPEGYSGK
jgi:CubicO group peptidase (beta-lactamase class C family)